jgi:hypothetical protein
MGTARTTPPPNAVVIWRREIDHDKLARRNQRFLRWYAIPLAVVLVVVAIAVDPWSALGILILFGGVGGLAYLWLWLTNRNERSNPVLWTEDGRLHISTTTSVVIADVDRYALRSKSESVSTSQGQNYIFVTRALFRMTDGSLRNDFQWIGLPESQQPALNDALWALFPGRSQAHEEMLAT